MESRLTRSSLCECSRIESGHANRSFGYGKTRLRCGSFDAQALSSPLSIFHTCRHKCVLPSPAVPVSITEKQAEAGLWERALETFETAPELPNEEEDA